MVNWSKSLTAAAIISGLLQAPMAQAYSVDIRYIAAILGDPQIFIDAGGDTPTNSVTKVAHDTGLLTSGESTVQVRASADLSTGKLKAFASLVVGPGVSRDTVAATASAFFTDFATFDLPSGLSTASVTAKLTLTGSVVGQINGGTLPQTLQFGDIRDEISLHDFVDGTVLSVTLDVQEAIPYLVLAGIGGTTSSTATIDLGNTATLTFELPAGVTFTSQSGVLLTEPVPLPGGFALLASSLCGLGLLRRRTS